MKKRFGISCRRRASGLTLVEVAAAAALMGTLLTAAVVVNARLIAQTRDAEQIVKGCAIADRLLEGWWADATSVPQQASGELAGDPGWRWRTSVVENAAACGFGAKVISLEVFAPDRGEGAPAARVEVLLPEKGHEGISGTDAD